MKTAIVHDWLVTYAGAERVLEQMLYCIPDADLFSIVDFLPKNERMFIREKSVITSFIQKLPWSKKYYRYYLPLMPLAVEQFDLSGYDLIISSSHAVAKGVITGPDQLHICMCYSPMRYAWDLQHQYLRETGMERGVKGMLARLMLHWLRIWDLRTSNGVDEFIAISHYISRRINKVYKRDSVVIYPPVDVDRFKMSETRGDYYVTASRMVPYKRIDLIVEAFSRMPERNLVVIGDGPEFHKIKSKATKNVAILGYQDSHIMYEYIRSARAFIFAAEEDFGIAPLEAQACGTPVIAFGKGGALETIVGGSNNNRAVGDLTGLFFDQQTADSICVAVDKFERDIISSISHNKCRENAMRFSQERFRKEFSSYIEHLIIKLSETKTYAER